MTDNAMRRREFVTLLGISAAAWPLAAKAQQPAMPAIGYLYPGVPQGSGAQLAAAFRKGLGEAGYVEGRNVLVEYRWAMNDIARLPELAADLVRRRVSVIVTPGSGGIAGRAAKAATSTIPIVFSAGADPVELGLVASLNRPGGNVTGFTGMAVEIVGKQLGLLHELLPAAKRFAVLVNPNSPATPSQIKNVQAAAASLGQEIEILYASTNDELDAAFASAVQKQADAILVGPGPLFGNRGVQLVSLAMYHRLPALYSNREAVGIGGLMSYGSSGGELARQVGLYAARILKGEKPADLPVQLATKFELVINLHTAKLLGLKVPPTLLAIADEVIE